MLIKKDILKMLPMRITMQDDILSAENEKGIASKEIEREKQVIDGGEWYFIEFYYPKCPIFICQKSLITTSTIEEFESMFEGLIVRHNNQTIGYSDAIDCSVVENEKIQTAEQIHHDIEADKLVKDKMVYDSIKDLGTNSITEHSQKSQNKKAIEKQRKPDKYLVIMVIAELVSIVISAICLFYGIGGVI